MGGVDKKDQMLASYPVERKRGYPFFITGDQSVGSGLGLIPKSIDTKYEGTFMLFIYVQAGAVEDIYNTIRAYHVSESTEQLSL
ncbi:hypothetical protein EVAR_80564_1 [Eumeta japonica]|uniref:Uncharacterized protein n=1 Tax=Eumeta variegata TaxID=151549 RepID=A0A4C1TNF2_EUMVA|nr:hypothetical protein EVAR_80564_1 [Eumeta japonica]